MTFKEAVEAAPYPVKEKYRSGKQALNGHRDRVNCKDSRRFTGSIDLDSALKKSFHMLHAGTMASATNRREDGNRQFGSKFTQQRLEKYRRSSINCNG